MRVVGFVSGPALPLSARGTKWTGLAHSSDWVPTLVEGVAGATLPAETGPRPLDGFDLWPALTTGAASPRHEVVHQVANEYFNESVQAIRVGDYKLIIGNPGDPRTIAFPEAGDKDVPFGLSNGTRHGPHKQRCYARSIPAPRAPPRCVPHCLFNIVEDVGESNDLSADPAYAGVLANLTQRLLEVGATGPPKSAAQAFPTVAGFHAATAKVCDKMRQSGFLEPLSEAELREIGVAPYTDA